MTDITAPEHPQSRLHRLFDRNFLDYTAYVIRERAIPDIDDGLKPVQRRILQTLRNMDDGRYHKVANVVGETMKLHPHGDQSIFAALVNLANKELLIDRQGNFGNVFTGDQASAARYIECRLTPLARETLFNPDLTAFVDSYDGRMQEPVTLPAKLPLLLLLGAEGIAVGMATKIMPHNFGELLQAQIDCLDGKHFTLLPDFPGGGIVDASDYQSGNGRLRCRARMALSDKTITITELPANLTTESLIESVERAAKAGKIKIASISDYTAEKVEIEIKLPRGVYAEEVVAALYAFTDCELSVSPSLVLIKDNMPCIMGVEEVLRHNTDKLRRDLEQELRIERGRLVDKLHAATLEQVFIKERLYKRIEEESSAKAVSDAVRQALELKPFADTLIRKPSKEDIERLLDIRIKRISRYDITKQEKEIRSIGQAITAIDKQLQDVTLFTKNCLRGLLDKYGAQFPRRSELKAFDQVDAREAAISNLLVVYDRASGFLGHKVSTSQAEIEVPCSDLDRIMLIFRDGLYKVIPVPDKLFIGSELLWAGAVRKNLVFNLIYRAGAINLSYIKRFRMPSFILNKEYRLFEEHKRSVIQMFAVGESGIRARVSLAPSARARSNVLELDFDDCLIKGEAAQGKRVSERAVRKVTDVTGQPKQELPAAPVLPGIAP